VETKDSLSSAERALGLPDSRWMDVGGPLHYREWEGPADGPVCVLVHGLGGGLLNWALVAPGLAEAGRVLAMDLPGFGKTPGAGRASTVASCRRVLDGFLRRLDLSDVVLFGNSMGGMVTLAQAEADPGGVRGLVLADAALPPKGSSFVGVPPSVSAGFLVTGTRRLGPALLQRRTDRLGAERMVWATLQYATAHPESLDPAWVAATLESFQAWVARPGASRVFSEASRSIVRAYLFARTYRRRLAGIRTPALLIHGAADRLVPVANAWHATREHANWDLVVVPDTGHIPQVEQPERFLRAVRPWLGRLPA
jgi:pimeloyl-ACP methyl ester carboxylesterase